MRIEYLRLDSFDLEFETKFSELENSFYDILSKSYSIFYGNEYHKERIYNGQAILYVAFVDDLLVAVTYVKRNKRRGGTAIYPEKYRQLGIAKKLIELSLIDFPKQYSILSTNFDYSHRMLSLLKNIGFKMATTKKEIKEIVGDEFTLLSNFRMLDGYFVFDRDSEKRETKREILTLLHTF